MRTTNYGTWAANRWTLGFAAACFFATGAGFLTDQFVTLRDHAARPFRASIVSAETTGLGVPAPTSTSHAASNPVASSNHAAGSKPISSPPSGNGLASIASNEKLTLEDLIEPAREALKYLQSVPDYSAKMSARERVNGTLRTAHLEIKVREQPFSVYVRHLAPKRLAGTECIYVEGQNNGKLLAHTTGLKHRLVGTLALQPDGALAMSEGRYPVTEVGLRRLVERMIRVGEKELPLGNCEVKTIPPRIINGRSCEGIEVTHPEKGDDFLYHIVRVYADPQTGVPVRFASYDWPANENEEPPLLEEYTYEDLQLNRGFTDQDFSVENPQYDFKRR
ncbi:MAG: DUF1571 domain-containing protein [Planctomycetaceae bacterium]|nr:DUF1571 domain-containing protein [Planctomycetaceae bacterium]